MRLTKILKATISKDLLIEGSNEDSAVLRLRGDVQRAAVFDGASESFAARKWSRILADEWGHGSEVSPLWLNQAQLRYKEQLDGLSLSWAQEAAMERGSFATIASVEVRNGLLDLCIVGDSSVFFIDSRGLKASYPFQSESQFSSAPTALSSRENSSKHNVDLLHSGRRKSAFVNAIGERKLLLATDAISCWLLSDNILLHLQRLHQLLSCETSVDFQQLVIQERKTNAMKIDDSTIILLRID